MSFRVRLLPTTKTVDWEEAEPVAILPDELLTAPQVSAPYLPLPAGAMDTQVFTRWARRFDRWLARTQRLAVTPKAEGDKATVGPKRGGVSVDLVAIAWSLE